MIHTENEIQRQLGMTSWKQLLDLRTRDPNVHVYISEVPVRHDTDTSVVNEIKKVKCMVVKRFLHSSLAKKNLTRNCSWKDGIHISDRCTAALLKLFQGYEEILKYVGESVNGSGKMSDSHPLINSTFCFFCGESCHISRLLALEKAWALDL